MIDKSVVRGLVKDWPQDKGYFLADVEVSKDGKIVIETDHADDVWIKDCVELSRYIEDWLDRDDEDYELEVDSVRLGQPFKVSQQYINFIGKEVEVLNGGGLKYRRILKPIDGNDFAATVDERVKVEGKKYPELQAVDRIFQIDKVKYTKYFISFK